MKEQIIRKLTSRKLWAAVFASALCMIAACFNENLTPEIVDLIKSAVSAGVAYIFGESAIDIFRQIAEAMKEKINTEHADLTTPTEGEDHDA